MKIIIGISITISFVVHAMEQDCTSLQKIYADKINQDRLCLSQQPLHRNSVEAIISLITTTPTLTCLSLIGVQLDNEGVTKIASALHHNNTLTLLNIRDNDIGDDGVLKFAEALTITTTLQILDLSGTKMGEAGAGSIANALKKNSSLINLYVSDNHFGDNGVIKIADGLKANNTLALLHMRSARIGKIGAEALANALVRNCTLKQLDIDYNFINDDGASSIAHALMSNSTLTSISIRCNHLHSGLLCLEEALNKNITLNEMLIEDYAEIHCFEKYEIIKRISNIIILHKKISQRYAHFLCLLLCIRKSEILVPKEIIYLLINDFIALVLKPFPHSIQIEQHSANLLRDAFAKTLVGAL